MWNRGISENRFPNERVLTSDSRYSRNILDFRQMSRIPCNRTSMQVVFLAAKMVALLLDLLSAAISPIDLPSGISIDLYFRLN